MDGGTVWNVNIDSAVKQCLTIVDDESKITVDVVVCGSPPTPTSKWSPGNDALSDYMYARDIHSFYSNADNLNEER